MTVYFHEEDLPDGVLAGTSALAVDTETMGLITHRDRLCLVQLSSGDGNANIVRVLREQCLATPAVVEGRVIIRTESFLYCFGFPKDKAE